MCVFFFEEDIKDLIVGQQRAKLALIDQMISSLEEGHVEEEEETSIGDGGIPTSDGESDSIILHVIMVLGFWN